MKNYHISIPERFELQVEKSSEVTALIYCGEEWSYFQLNQYSNYIYHNYLYDLSCTRLRVAILVERSVTYIASMLSVLKSGNTYIPLDVEHPEERINMIINESEPDIIITNEKWSNILTDRRIRAICPDITEFKKSTQFYSNPGVDIKSNTLAYMIYTSGSTGKPKGVMIPHRALSNLINSMIESPGFYKTDRLLAVTTFSFDLSVPDIYLPLICGGSCIIASKDNARDPYKIINLLEDNNCTFMQATPATWQMMIETGWTGKQNLKIVCGGEALSIELAGLLFDKCDEIWNMYGPTETTVWSTCEKIKNLDRISIGKPIQNTTIYVLDNTLNAVKPNAVGELYIGGIGLADGYYNQPKLTKSVFIENPFKEDDIIYKTGDLARYLPDGRLECLGRNDFQVKIRGFRIELGDIEFALSQMPGVSQVIIHPVQLHPGLKSLVAYCIADKISISNIRDYLIGKLPDYMIPSYVVALDSFPLNPNGKIDRKMLPKPDIKTVNYEKSTSFDDEILQIWKNVLGVSRINMHDDFFDLGGNSILAVRLITTVKEVSKIKINLSSFFQNSLFSNFLLLAQKSAEEVSTVISLQPHGDLPSLFCIGGIDLYKDLANALGKQRPVFGVFLPYEQQLIEHIEKNTLIEWAYLTIEGMAESYLKAIKQKQPNGPYNLLGVSIAGFIAFEAARQLLDAGEEVSSLLIFDSLIPSAVTKTLFGYSIDFFRAIKNKYNSFITKKNRFDSDGNLATSFIAQVRDEINDKAIEAYNRKKIRIPIDVCLIKAMDNIVPPGVIISNDMGWGDKVSGQLHIIESKGDHLGLLEYENISKISLILDDLMNKKSCVL